VGTVAGDGGGWDSDVIFDGGEGGVEPSGGVAYDDAGFVGFDEGGSVLGRDFAVGIEEGSVDVGGDEFNHL